MFPHVNKFMPDACLPFKLHVHVAENVQQRPLGSQFTVDNRIRLKTGTHLQPGSEAGSGGSQPGSEAGSGGSQPGSEAGSGGSQPGSEAGSGDVQSRSKSAFRVQQCYAR